MRNRFFDVAEPPEEGAPPPPLWRRLSWFVALMLAGLLVVAGSAYALRALLFIG